MMDTQAEVERIRARMAGNITDTFSARDDNVEEFIDEELVQARHDCRILLDALDAQSAVIAAAVGVIDSSAFQALPDDKWVYVDGFGNEMLILYKALDAMGALDAMKAHDALDAMKGEGT